MSKVYVVKLTIRAGEYEKSVTKLVCADTEELANDQALLGECHGSIDDGTAEYTETGIADLGWEFHYSVDWSKEVHAEHVPVLRTYFDMFGEPKNLIAATQSKLEAFAGYVVDLCEHRQNKARTINKELINIPSLVQEYIKTEGASNAN